METPKIEYDLNERGRVHHGEPRHYTKQELIDLSAHIRSDERQERVSNGDMYGFLGHWARLKYGYSPDESSRISPAIVTTYLDCTTDGIVTHQQRFLDSCNEGKQALGLWQSKFGGFSTVIDPDAPFFHGVDFAYRPNYLKNKGYFDSADESMYLKALCKDGECSTDKLEVKYLIEKNEMQQVYLDSVMPILEEVMREDDNVGKVPELYDASGLEQVMKDRARFDSADLVDLQGRRLSERGKKRVRVKYKEELPAAVELLKCMSH